ncbi:MAG: hypothetical protein CMJ59_07930 [Planctomycetaceae bacterium]|nr:hypothetical protein [Planctomycetaceae bacterium]
MLPIATEQWAVDQYCVHYHGYAPTCIDSLGHFLIGTATVHGHRAETVVDRLASSNWQEFPAWPPRCGYARPRVG